LVEAIDNRFVPEVKSVRPYKAFSGRLALGDFTKYPETALYIDIIRYTKTKKASPPSASSVVVNNGASNGQSSATLGDTDMPDAPDLSAVKNHYVYQVDDPNCPGGKKDVERDDLAKGYAYGRTAVHISEAEKNITEMDTVESFSIIGFIPSNMVRFSYLCLTLLIFKSTKDISQWERAV
jgi:ATP-dependent DNA helicase 2 subunit 2